MADDLIERLRDERHCNDWYLRQEAAQALTEAKAEADKYCTWWREERDKRIAAESALTDLRRKAREVVGGMLAHSCVADAGPDCKDADGEAAERAARRFMEKVK